MNDSPVQTNWPSVSVSECEGMRYLHLGDKLDLAHGIMRIAEPVDLAWEYTRRMMAAALFWSPGEDLHNRQALQLGLGTAALTKFCYQRLGMRTAAVEIHPHVLACCHAWFELPAANERLQLLLGDAAQEIQAPRWRGVLDLLHVDFYDEEPFCPVLDSVDFYADCRKALSPKGCMSLNLFCRGTDYPQSVAKIAQVFGAGHLWGFTPLAGENTVVLAFREAPQVSPADLMPRIQKLREQWAWEATDWETRLRPIEAL